MRGVSWADVVAAVHLLVVAVVVSGGLLALRDPRLLRLHVPVAAGALLVNLTGSDCPLTTLELQLRAARGEQPYDGGFLGHYVLGPLLGPTLPPSADSAVLVAAALPNVVAYGLLALRWRRTATSPRTAISTLAATSPHPATSTAPPTDTADWSRPPSAVSQRVGRRP